MNKDSPIIIWEKWIDPFGENIEDAHWTDYESNIDNVDFLDENDSDNLTEEPSIHKNIRAIATPMGIIPYNELTAPSHLFNFWVGHANFNITKDIASILEQTDCVEILDIFSRYRFRVGIGKCFNSSETMKQINDNVYRQLS